MRLLLSFAILVASTVSVVVTVRPGRPQWEWKLDLFLVIALTLSAADYLADYRWGYAAFNFVTALVWFAHARHDLTLERPTP